MSHDHLALQWHLAYVLPNLTLNHPIEVDRVAIVPYRDKRLHKVMESMKNVRDLMNGFFTDFNEQIEPSALIVRADIVPTVDKTDALIAFRNIAAIASILPAWRATLQSPMPHGTLYSNYFDLYPLQPYTDGEHFGSRSPVKNDMFIRGQFHGCMNPMLTHHAIVSANSDVLLFEPIAKIWQEFYLTKKSRHWNHIALFRSIHLAYQASAIPFGSQPALFDYGTSAALWVSAFEALTHPGRNEYAGLRTVTELLSEIDLPHPRARQRRYTINIGRGKKSKLKAALPAKLYTELYRARNDFLHGNPVTTRTLFPFRNRKAPALVHLAPVLYDIALGCYLQRMRFLTYNRDEWIKSIPYRWKLIDLSDAIRLTIAQNDSTGNDLDDD